MNEYKWYNDDFQNDVTHEPEIKQEPYTAPEQKTKKTRKARTVKLPVMILAIVLTAVVSVSGYALLSPAVSGSPSLEQLQPGVMDTDESGNTSNASTIVNSNRQVLTVPDIVDKVGPAVVGVINRVQNNNIYYGYFGGIQNGNNEMVDQGSGSGVLISADGYIVTNNHVIEGAQEVGVILSTGDEYKATVVGADSRTDLAVLKIDGSNLPYATLGSSSDLRVGELAVAIGNPLGQEFAGTVTSGIISALNRSVTVDNKQLTLIQTDAAINPGNSGGPLVNQYGEVIGINTVKISSSELEGLGFAIPMDEAKPVINDLLQYGYVKGRPVIGIGGRSVTERDAQAYNMKVGVYVASMTADSPAYMAGIQIGDIITEMDGQPVTTVEEMNAIKNQHQVGDTIELTVYRQGDDLKIKLVLGEEMPE